MTWIGDNIIQTYAGITKTVQFTNFKNKSLFVSGVFGGGGGGIGPCPPPLVDAEKSLYSMLRPLPHASDHKIYCMAPPLTQIMPPPPPPPPAVSQILATPLLFVDF